MNQQVIELGLTTWFKYLLVFEMSVDFSLKCYQEYNYKFLFFFSFFSSVALVTTDQLPICLDNCLGNTGN